MVEHKTFIEPSDVEKLKELLKTRLTESGWRDEMKAVCRDIIREKGVENVTVESLVKEMTPKGRELVSDSIKRELLQKIRGSCIACTSKVGVPLMARGQQVIKSIS